MNDLLKSNLNELFTFLAESESFHRRLGNQMRKNSMRGFARMHDALCCYYFNSRNCLEKLLGDNCGYYPSIFIDALARSEIIVINQISETKQIFPLTKAKLEKAEAVLNVAITESRKENICLYKKLCCLQEIIQTVIAKIEILWKRLELGGWGGHDIGIVNMILHKYYEEHSDGECHDWNIG